MSFGHAPLPKPDPQIDAIADRHGRDVHELLPILRDVQRESRALNRPTIDAVARSLAVPAHRVEGVATFYALLAPSPPGRRIVRLCDGLVCRLSGADACRETLSRNVAAHGRHVVRSGCLGLCDRAPAALVDDERQVGPLSTENAAAVIAAANDVPFVPRILGSPGPLLKRIGRVDPESIDEALEDGAYSGLESALRTSPERVIAEIERAGLDGRGGAGFPTGVKWRHVANSSEPTRYVVCNADESEPLLFKDRALLAGDPHLVLEGIALAAFAVGAREGIVYVRGEYEPQARTLERAIAQAEERGWLGDRIADSDFSFRLRVHRGAGAYVCGEETALLESLEGRRGEPRLRPPYPTQAGLHGRPTVVNNVETLAAAATILRDGVEAFRAVGPSDRPGTRLLTLLGHVRTPGLIETDRDRTLGELIETFGGGLRDGSEFGFALTGGAAGTFVTARSLDARFDDPSAPEPMTAGAGGILVCDRSVSPVETLREIMRFFEDESCGKCTPCRIGTSIARRTLDELQDGRGTPAHVDRLSSLATSLREASLCGLGKTAALPLTTALDRFPDRFDDGLP